MYELEKYSEKHPEIITKDNVKFRLVEKTLNNFFTFNYCAGDADAPTHSQRQTLASIADLSRLGKAGSKNLPHHLLRC